MPLYPLKCQDCDTEIEVFRTIAERDSLPKCSCGGKFHRVLTASFVRGEIPSYVSPFSGEIIDSRAKRRADMRKGGYIDYEPGMERDVEKNRKRSQERAFEPIAADIDKLVTDLNNSGKLETSNA